MFRRMVSGRQTWRRGGSTSVNDNYMHCDSPAAAVNDGGKVDRVCKCGIVVYDGGANEPAVLMVPA